MAIPASIIALGTLAGSAESIVRDIAGSRSKSHQAAYAESIAQHGKMIHPTPIARQNTIQHVTNLAAATAGLASSLHK